MIKEIDTVSDGENEKILVCITAQSNSKRLINEGAKLADELNGELHILNVQKGSSIFNNNETPVLLQNLFIYGTEKGGMIHAFCDENIPKSISEFVLKEKITYMVLGEPPNYKAMKASHNENQFDLIIKAIDKSKTKITIVGREDN